MTLGIFDAAVLPVVRVVFWMAFHHVAGDIVLLDVVGKRVLHLDNAEVKHARRRAWNVIIIYEVQHSHAPVVGAVLPVVNDVVTYIEIAGELFGAMLIPA